MITKYQQSGKGMLTTNNAVFLNEVLGTQSWRYKAYVYIGSYTIYLTSLVV